MTLIIGAGILGVALAAAGLYYLFGFLSNRSLAKSLEFSLLLVKIPKTSKRAETSGDPAREFKSEVNRFEQLVSNLGSLKNPFVLEIAVPHIGEEIHFYIGVPRKSMEVAAKQVQGIWNGASVEQAGDDYNIFNPGGAAAAVYLAQKEDYALPIRTYQELEADSFSSILGAFSKVGEIGEGAAMQVIVRPASKSSKKHVHGYIEMIKKGESLENVLHHGVPHSISGVGRLLNPKSEQEEKRDRIVDEEAVKMLNAKIGKPLFQVNVRLLASAPSPFQANDILDAIIAGFEQFAAPQRNAFKIVKPRNPESIITKFIYRTFDSGSAMTVSSEEIASFYHFPISSTDTPRVKWLKSKEAPPPANLPNEGTLIGENTFRGQRKHVYITEEDRKRHVYMVGQTGAGKSTLLGNMVIEDIEKGRGVALIDPHGDLVESALANIPRERLDDLIVFDPSDLERPLGLNMLDYNYNRPEEKTFIVNEMQSIFNKLFSQETMGPMFEQYMRNALLLLMEDMPNEPATLVEVPRIFTDTEYRRRKVSRIHNPVVIDFWEKEAVRAGGEASLANMTPYITSKFNNFISNDYVRPIIGQAKSAFNFRDAMDSGKILLINLSKGRIGDINAGLLGMVFTGKILMSALSRADIADHAKRRNFNLYIDEFQNFTTDAIASILSEARKYGLTLTVAHQFIAQLQENIRDAVFGNVGSQIVFRVGVQDAEFLVKQFEPTFDENDLIGIDNLNAYVKILINGETSKPFNIKIETRSWNKGNKVVAEKMKEYTRIKYGMDRRIVEDEIFRRLRE
ncbi:MAG: type IV secretory system conjugative DNA transfer family protein [Candidatus Liptonbacteria bacterium]